MNVLITGAKGQLGLEIASLETKFPYFILFFADKSLLNIADFKEVESYISKNKIDVIVNCAAYTNVDKAEDEPEMANEINHLAVKNLAVTAKKHSLKLIHISTDYVFDGESSIPYSERDSTNPQNVYGSTKLKGEEALLKINPKNSIIIRTSWVYSEYGHNFVKTMLRLSKEKKSIAVVFDQIGSPTYAKDLAKVLLQIIPKINHESVQIYHYANKGDCSWFQFASAIMKIAQQSCKVLPINTSEFKTKTKRPKFSLMNTEKIQQKFNLEIPNWEDSLNKCILKIKKPLSSQSGN